MLRKWWTAKYRQTWTHKNLGDLTYLELLTEFYEDLYAKDKTAMLEDAKDENGHYAFESTGDDLIDKWERELAMGLEPDLMEGLSQAAIDTMDQEAVKSKRAKKQLGDLTSADDLFNDGLKANPMYATRNGNWTLGDK